MSFRFRLVAPVFLTLSLLGSGSVAAERAPGEPAPQGASAHTPAEQEAARAEYKAGNREFEAGNKVAAREHYLKSLEIAPSFEAYCNLGRAEGELGLDADALLHLDSCLREYPPSEDEQVQAARAKFYDLRKTIRERCDAVQCAGVEPVAPEAKPASEGAKPSPEPAGPAVEPLPPVDSGDEEPQQPSAKWPVVVATGVVGLVAAGVGAGFWVHSDNLATEARGLRADLVSDEVNCFDRGEPGCKAYYGKVSDHDVARTVAVTGFVSGGVLVLTAAVLAGVWQEPEVKVGAARVILRPVAAFAPTGGFVGISGRF